MRQLPPLLGRWSDSRTPQGSNRVGYWRDHGGSGCGSVSVTAMEGKLRRSFLSDRLELRLLLVAQRSVEALKRGAHQMDRSLHGFEPPFHCVKASGWCGRVFRLASSVQDVGSPGIGVLQHFKSGALSIVRVQPGLDLVRRPLQRGCAPRRNPGRALPWPRLRRRSCADLRRVH